MTKKKIIVLTSGGGGGHISATHALESYLGHQYEIKPVFAFLEIFKWHDFTRYFSWGKLDGEEIYNWLLHKKIFWAIEGFYSAASWYMKTRQKALTKVMVRYLQKHKPDILISVIPIVNGIALDAAQELGIPFLIVPTDLNEKGFVLGIEKPAYSHFTLAKAFDEPLSNQTIECAQIPTSHIKEVGFPLRSNFFASQDRALLKRQWHVSAQKPVLLLMMGGQGSSGILKFTKELSKLDQPVHILICIGKCERMRPKIEKIKLPDGITTTIIGYTERIAELMSIADIIITKSGTVSFCEALYSEKPILLDGTNSVLRWEKLNHQLLEKYEFGQVIKKLSDTKKIVSELLHNKELYEKYRHNLAKFPKKRADIEIPKLVDSMISKD